MSAAKQSGALRYNYALLNRLISATYSTGEVFEYAYDAVGNRTAMTTTEGSTTYEYDAANRLTSVGGVTYTWDARGNLISDGTFTYTHNSAGRMVRAESADATLAYTYTADGLRVAQSVDGDVTTFAWDWASGVPEMLAQSPNPQSPNPQSLYLVGHDTLGAWDGESWTYHLPDALGSVRQVADGAGAVVSSREWTPYGVEVGAAQPGLGYTGEWWDAGVRLQYLRARWYDVGVGRFTRRDVWEGNYLRPQTLGRWTYVEGNPINFTDPSGHCISGSDCERFAAEAQRFVDEAQAQTLLLGEQLSDDWIVHMLAGYYSGYRMTGEFLGCTMAIPPGWISRGDTPERYWPRDDSIWRIDSESPDERAMAEAAALSYGFKRIFYVNTHHYFANFHMAWFYGSFSASASNNPREQYQYFIQGVDYYETAADILIVDVAIKHVKQIRTTPGTGIEMLPQLLREDACGNSIEEIYAEWVWPNPYIESWLGPPPP